jgi:hypothetical protein
MSRDGGIDILRTEEDTVTITIFEEEPMPDEESVMVREMAVEVTIEDARKMAAMLMDAAD